MNEYNPSFHHRQFKIKDETVRRVDYLTGIRSLSLTPSKAAFLAALTAASVVSGLCALCSAGEVLSALSFSRAISYARAAFSLVSKTPM